VTCDELRSLLHPYVDGELDLVRGLEVERHLEACPACAQALEQQQALRGAFGGADLYHRAPADLRQRIRSSLRPPRTRRLAIPAQIWVPVGVAAALLLGSLLAWGILGRRPGPSAEDALAQDVVSSQARSLVAEHLYSVKSSNTHTVKPWLDKRLDFAVPVTNLEAEGYPLAGGRLDYLHNERVAALVYERRDHIINVFVWPTTAADEPPQTQTRRGYHLIHWTRGGLTYWAISDLNEAELQQFVELLRH
jgi:anti-sigma factor RsiW